MTAQRAQDVLDFWFGDAPGAVDTLPQRLRFWFGGTDPPEVLMVRDEDLERRFLALTEAAARGDLDGWSGSPRRQLALILLLDTFPRHIWRGTERAFAQDPKALALTLQGLQQGADATLTVLERLFYYLPLSRSESAAIQEESLAAFRRLPDEAPESCRDALLAALATAEQNAALIRRFGRFPQHNQLLGRRSTGIEQTYLREQAVTGTP
jgi:uncharacterized protein (DUF924 family)